MATTSSTNSLGQPVGFELPGWRPALLPDGHRLNGKFGAVEKLDVGRHGDDLFEAVQMAPDDRDWTYLAYGPFHEKADWLNWLTSIANVADPFFYTVLDADNKACGLASLMRIDPNPGVIEIGHIHLLAPLQRTALATEALSLLMHFVFESGYRRLEWKCDSCNARSKASAGRLGFTYEGLFRQATIVRGRNRDTSWFSILDTEWPVISAAHQQWLSEGNFDASGKQRQSLRDLTAKSD